ncbi:MAG: DNA polymerase III subunit gamma/tau [Betaproteobacteria bacterium]|nr:MAG: DNA polymerase III subunit gamma/tau [Betaproteobacteria bacterium]
MSQTQVLARKWRPKDFSGLTGQNHIVQALTNALEQKRLHHAYLFTGTRGVGKTTIARILSKALNCETGITSTPCGKCSACIEIDSGHFVDLVELDAASNTQVDNMRELLENALYAPTCARYKIYIIDEVHMLSKSAFNAMLKTLEEPPDHVKFMLATTDPQKIPITVLSRCLQFNLKQIPPNLIAIHLKYVLEQEKISYDEASLQLLARAAQGSMRDALSMLDQAIIFGKGKVEETEVHAMLGNIDQSYLYDLLEALAQKDGAQMLAVADAIEVRSLSFDVALQDLARLFHSLSLAQIVPQAISEDAQEHEQICSLAKKFMPEDLQLFYQIALHGRSDLGLAPDEYSGFTMALMRMLAFAPESSSENITASLRPSSVIPKEKLPLCDGKGEKLNIKTEHATASALKVQTALNPDTCTNQSNGNWAVLMNQLKLNGMTKMLAQNCEMKSFSTDNIELCVQEKYEHLLEKTYQDKIKTALSEHFRKPIRLKFSVGSVAGMTPAELNTRERQAKQLQAITAIETDSFVRELIDNFDAKLIISSIKPI